MDTLSADDSPLNPGSLDWMLRFRFLTMARGLTAQGLTMTDGATANEVKSPLTLAQVQTLSPVALAYIGDAVYELFVRGLFLLPPKRIHEYHRQVVGQVRAEQQALCVDRLVPWLTPAEQDILRRGRNASPRGPKRLEGAVYQRATGFETLIGYLYLTDPDRLADLLRQIDFTDPQKNDDPPNPGDPSA